MTRAALSRSAQVDLRHIQAWIQARNATAATAYLEDLVASFRHLAAWPLTGRSAEQYRPGLRIFVCREHLIYDRPTTSGIVVVRVVHGRREQGKIFR